jgi:hypothetical protein
MEVDLNRALEVGDRIDTAYAYKTKTKILVCDYCNDVSSRSLMATNLPSFYVLEKSAS